MNSILGVVRGSIPRESIIFLQIVKVLVLVVLVEMLIVWWRILLFLQAVRRGDISAYVTSYDAIDLDNIYLLLRVLPFNFSVTFQGLCL